MNDLFVILKSKFFDELVLDADNRAEVIHIQHALEKAVQDPDEVRGVGQPVKIFNDPWTGKMFTTCSRCDGKISPKDCYCKHCGARMKGAEDGN